MRLLPAAVRSFVVLASLALSSAASAQVHPQNNDLANLKYMGQFGCGDWPKSTDYTNVQKGALLNWVLGYLDRSSFADSLDLLKNVDQGSISAWMDNYCATHPLNTIIDGTQALEKELVERARGGR